MNAEVAVTDGCACPVPRQVTLCVPARRAPIAGLGGCARVNNMDRFDRALLSPLRVPGADSVLPFSLDWQVIAAGLVGLDEERVSECRAIERYRIRGLRARDRSTILTVSYPTTGGGVAIVDIFVKRTPRTLGEARRHGQLSAAGVPLPRLLWRTELPDREDVLGFEFLDTIGIDFVSDDEVSELLTLLARLNAVAPRALGESANPPAGRPEAEFTALVRDALAVARSGGLLDWAPRSIDEWLALYRDAKSWAARMPTAVTHGEMYFQQVGRAKSGPLVMFDLATVGLRPRFADLGSVIRGLVERGGEEVQLIGCYLGALLDVGHRDTIDATDAIEELRRLRVLGAFQSLPWLTRSVDDPDLGPKALLDNINGLRDDLVALAIVDS